MSVRLQHRAIIVSVLEVALQKVPLETFLRHHGIDPQQPHAIEQGPTPTTRIYHQWTRIYAPEEGALSRQESPEPVVEDAPWMSRTRPALPN